MKPKLSNGKVAEHPSGFVARFIEDARQRRDANALRWVIQRAGFALMRCYPEDRDILWGVLRGVAGRDREEG